jgi:predicted deacetylase
MQHYAGENISKFYAKRKRRLVISIACLVILICLLPVGILKNTTGNMEKPSIIIRVDDIQDYAFREAQFFLLNHSLANHIPLSLAVITGEFGEDKEIVEMTKLASAAGSEVTVHGWKHENFTDFTPEEQAELLSKSKRRIQEILNLETTIFVPPMFKFNQDTLTVMNTNGYTIFSTFTHNAEPGLISGILSLPGTVQVSDYYGEKWQIKNTATLIEEITASIHIYGFAIIITHPQEFLTDGELDQSKMEMYRELLEELMNQYSFTTMQKLGENLLLK